MSTLQAFLENEGFECVPYITGKCLSVRLEEMDSVEFTAIIREFANKQKRNAKRELLDSLETMQVRQDANYGEAAGRFGRFTCIAYFPGVAHVDGAGGDAD